MSSHLRLQKDECPKIIVYTIKLVLLWVIPDHPCHHSGLQDYSITHLARHLVSPPG